MRMGIAMARFLNTSGTNYFLEELIKSARERLYLISPYLKLNNRIKELLEDKDRLKIDVRIVYGKTELQPSEVSWLKGLRYVRTSYCHHLHAKCYLSESAGIITSLNLYDFSQINNNEMGIYFTRNDDTELYQDTYEEAQRIIRISDEVKISLDVVDKESDDSTETVEETDNQQDSNYLTTTKLAESLGKKPRELNQILLEMGYQEKKEKNYFLTDAGKQAGAILRRGKFGWFIMWPRDLKFPENFNL